MANQVTENLFNAMDEIINARLQALNYDTTVKAMIINDKQADRGIYEVSEIGSENTSVFTAHSDNTSYQKNDCVYVTIPRGDTAAENKIIIGKYVEDGDAYYNYVNPMESFLEVTGNLIQALNGTQWGLTANKESDSTVDLWSAQDLNLRGFDRLALKGQFKTWLQTAENDVVSGNYGLMLLVESATGEIFTFALTTKEMYGNPYNYETFYAQEILLDISAIEEIKGMYLTLFQANDFRLSDGTKAPSENVPPNIFMKAPYVSVGYDVSNFDGDDLRIYTQDEQSYDCYEASVEKTIEAKWIHVTEGVSAVVVDDRIEMPKNPDYGGKENSRYPQPEEKADLTWYTYDKNSSGTIITGKNWKQISDNLNQFKYTFNTDTSVEGNTIPAMRFRAIIETPSVRYINAQFALSDIYETVVNASATASYTECVDILHDIMDGVKTQNDGRKEIAEIYTNNMNEFGSEDYGNLTKALNEYISLKSEVVYVQSGELSFPNLGYDPAKYAKDNIADLEIIVDPGGLKGQYLIYDDTGMITNPSEAEQVRYCEAKYKTLAGVLTDTTSGSDFKYQVDDTEMICWYIPLQSTMIATPTEGIEYNNYDIVDTDYEVEDPNNAEGLPLGHYCKIERTPQKDSTKVDEDLMLAEHNMYCRQQFRIKDYYTQMETNNQIYCRVTKQGKFYMGIGSMSFGIAGTNGTDATFILRLYETDDDGVSLSTTPASALSLKTLRYSEDNNGNLVSKIETDGQLIIVPELYDYNNRLIEGYFRESGHSVSYKLLTYEGYNQPFSVDDIYSAQDSQHWLKWKGRPDDLDGATHDFYCVIEAEVPYKIIYEYETYEDKDFKADLGGDPALLDLGKKVGDYKLDEEGNKIPKKDPNTGELISREDKLKTYLPVSIIKNKLLKRTKKITDPNVETRPNDIDPSNYLRQIIGANKVIYDRNGSNAKYYKDPYQLLNGLLEEVPGVEWYARIRASDGKTGAEKASIESFYPTVSPAWKLIPLEMYILGNSIAENFCVYGKKDGHVVCVQPVLIMQNKYGSSMLNKWDGSLTIDEKNGTILASMVGAGIKDENNTFSGVLMGDITQAYDDNHNGLGLYGFNKSDQSFGFNIDGTAFIGKAGHGRIWFNGNQGTITSGAYSDGVSDKYVDIYTKQLRPQQGMEIDLDGSDGISASLKAFGAGGGFVLDVGQKDFPSHLKINNQAATELVDIPVVFKLFAGKHGTKIYETTTPEDYTTYERGLIYFDADGEYIQSLNYNGKYNENRGGGFTDAYYPAGLSIHTNPPGWVDLGPTATASEINDANNNGDTPATQGTFIDLRNGWIDTRSGIVGGWRVGQDFIASDHNEIVLWAGGPETNESDGIPYLKIGAVRNNEMHGKLWIADYRVIGKTMTSDNNIGIQTVSSDELKLDNTDFATFITDDSAQDRVNSLVLATTKLEAGLFYTNALNSWRLQDDTADNKNYALGTVLETAIGGSNLEEADDPKEGIIVWRPAWEKTTLKKFTASLGTADYPWTNVYADNGFFYNESFVGFDGKTYGGWHLVATQDWVAKVVIAALNKRIKEVNDLASKALSRANNAINDILTWCASWDQKQVISRIEPGEKYIDSTIRCYVYKIVAQRTEKGSLTGEVSIEELDKTATGFTGKWMQMGPSAGGAYPGSMRDVERLEMGETNSVNWAIHEVANSVGEHTHKIKLESCLSGKIKLDTYYAKNTDLTQEEIEIFKTGTDGGVTCSADGGKITVSVTVAGGTATGNFNIADWEYYQNKIQSAYKAGFAAGQNSVTLNKASHDFSNAKYSVDGGSDQKIDKEITITGATTVKLKKASCSLNQASLNKPDMTDPTWSTLY